MILRMTGFFACFIVLYSLCIVSCKVNNQRSADEGTNVSVKFPAIVEVTADAGLEGYRHDNGARGNMYFPEQMGSGGGFVDYNGDHWLDILLVGGGPLDTDPSQFIQALRLYKNNGNGTFTEVTEEAGLAGIEAYGNGINAADFDNDGDEDFYFTTLRRNYLFRNDGGKFTSIGREAGVSDQEVWSSSSIFFDADRDGDLDLYVCNYAEWSAEDDIFCSAQGIIIPVAGQAEKLVKQYGRKVYCPPSEFKGIAGRFYRNNGDGTFREETDKAGFLPSPGKSLGVAECDYNRDGWPDLVVANDAEADLLFKNNGDGTFTEIGKSSGIAFDEKGLARAGMGIDIGVVDGSGRETVFIGNFSSETVGVYTYKGNDLFRDRVNASKLGHPTFLTLTFAVTLFDIEYDGDLDLLLANGHVWSVRPSLDGSTYRQPAQLFLNDGSGTFSEFSADHSAVFKQAMVARGSSYGDYDHDGDLDILLTENNGPVHLWRNELSDANYLRVRLQGKISNSQGIGSQIIAVCGRNRMYRRIRTGSSYLSQIEKIASFGLAQNTRVDSLFIQWPSGQLDVLSNLDANQELLVREGSSPPK